MNLLWKEAEEYVHETDTVGGSAYLGKNSFALRAYPLKWLSEAA